MIDIRANRVDESELGDQVGIQQRRTVPIDRRRVDRRIATRRHLEGRRRVAGRLATPRRRRAGRRGARRTQ